MEDAGKVLVGFSVMLIGFGVMQQDIKVIDAPTYCVKFGMYGGKYCDKPCGQCQGDAFSPLALKTESENPDSLQEKALHSTICSDPRLENTSTNSRRLCEQIDSVKVGILAAVVFVLVSGLMALTLSTTSASSMTAGVGGLLLAVTSLMTDPNAFRKPEQMEKNVVSVGCVGNECIGNGSAFFAFLSAGVFALMGSVQMIEFE